MLSCAYLFCSTSLNRHSPLPRMKSLATAQVNFKLFDLKATSDPASATLRGQRGRAVQPLTSQKKPSTPTATLVASSKTQTKKDQRRDCPLQASQTLTIYDCHKSLLIEMLTSSSAPASSRRLKNNFTVTGHVLLCHDCLGFPEELKWLAANPSNRVSAIC